MWGGILGGSLAVTLTLARINGFGGAVGPCRALPPAMLRERLMRAVGAALLTWSRGTLKA